MTSHITNNQLAPELRSDNLSDLLLHLGLNAGCINQNAMLEKREKHMQESASLYGLRRDPGCTAAVAVRDKKMEAGVTSAMPSRL
jgi:hypothetical protein